MFMFDVLLMATLYMNFVLNYCRSSFTSYLAHNAGQFFPQDICKNRFPAGLGRFLHTNMRWGPNIHLRLKY